ncbi:MAG TPA: hypothetical protein VGM23_00030 [Armatimonadota bacterium]|jgi:hypothetical protein
MSSGGDTIAMSGVLSFWGKLVPSTIHNPWLFFLAIGLSTIAFVVVMLLLHRLPPQGKKWLTIVCTFVAGLYFLLEFLIPAHKLPDGSMGNFITPTTGPVSNYVQYIFMWMLGLGIISLGIVHGRRLLKRLPGWHNSLAFFVAAISITVVGFMTNAGVAGPKAVQATYDTLFVGFFSNLDSAVFALLAFYIASAAYRAFRVRTVEAGLLMASALLVMLGLVSVGVMLTSGIPIGSPWAFFRLERLSVWILSVVNMPGQRAVAIGVAVGSLAMAMRLWLSLERGTFFSQE